MIFDAVVVGAGPAGSTTAALLAGIGVRVLLLDRARFPRPKPCGDYLSPGCVAALHRLGAERVLEAGHPVPGMRLTGPRGTSVPARFSGGGGRAIRRSALDALLLSRASAAGAVVAEGARVTGLVQTAAMRHRITVERADRQGRREAYEARLVIGADGLRSTVARLAGAGAMPRTGPLGVGGYIEGLDPEPAAGPPLGELHLGGPAYCGVAYLPGGAANVTAAIPREAVRRCPGHLDGAYWAALRSLPALAPRIGRARLAGTLRASGPLGFFRRRAAGAGWLLVGDAAEFIDPMTGQGVCLAVQGAGLAAEVAATALSRGGPTARNLARYERARRRSFRGLFLLSRALGRLAVAAPIAERALRRMAASSTLSTRFMDAVGGAVPAAAGFHPQLLAGLLGL